MSTSSSDELFTEAAVDVGDLVSFIFHKAGKRTHFLLSMLLTGSGFHFELTNGTNCAAPAD